MVVDSGHTFHVIGSGGVYVVDGSGIPFCGLSEEQSEGILSSNDVRQHVFGENDSFDLTHRRPLAADGKGDVEVIPGTQRPGEEAT